MRIVLHGEGGTPIAEIVSEDVLVAKPQDMLDLMAHPDIGDADRLILARRNFAPEFYRLASGLLGEVLQKITNYRRMLAIHGDFSDITSEPFKALMRESNRGRQVFFTVDAETARQALAAV
jgi:hypothetical protein